MHCSLFAGIISILAGGDACAAVRIENTNRYYAQQAAEQRAAQVASVNDIHRMAGVTAPTAQPEQVPESVPANDAQSEACSAIYPNGEFQIARPTAGLGANGAQTCVAVVELRGYQKGVGGTDVVLARANVAAGSMIDCNISAFPESSYTRDAQNVVFPADAEPTTEDVKKVMNQEQKQNAGLKIAAATLVGAIGGNIAGKNDVGKDNLMGTDKGKVQGTVIGALGGAAIGVGGAYAGKVGGDMIMSAGINAAAGGVIGNIMAADDNSVLRIENCEIEGEKNKKCLWGYLVKGDVLAPKIVEEGEQSTVDKEILCKNGKTDCLYKYFIDLDNGESVMRCDVNGKACVSVVDLISIEIDGKPLDDMERHDLDDLKNKPDVYHIVAGEGYTNEMKQGPAGSDGHTFGVISGAKIADARKTPVLVAFEEKEGLFGKTKNIGKHGKVIIVQQPYTIAARLVTAMVS